MPWVSCACQRLVCTLCLDLWLRREGESSGSLSGLWLLDSDEDFSCEVMSMCPHWRRAATVSRCCHMPAACWALCDHSPVVPVDLLPDSVTCCCSGSWAFFSQTRQLLDTLWVTCSVDSVLNLPQWRQHQIPQIKGSVHETVSSPLSPSPHWLQVPVVTCASDSWATGWQFPLPPCWV